MNDLTYLAYESNHDFNNLVGGNNASLKVMVKSLFMFCIFCFHYVDFFALSSRERLIKPRHQYDSIQNNIIKVQKLSYTSLYSISLKVGESFINLYSIFWKWGESFAHIMLKKWLFLTFCALLDRWVNI